MNRSKSTYVHFVGMPKKHKYEHKKVRRRTSKARSMHFVGMHEKHKYEPIKKYVCTLRRYVQKAQI